MDERHPLIVAASALAGAGEAVSNAFAPRGWQSTFNEIDPARKPDAYKSLMNFINAQAARGQTLQHIRLPNGEFMLRTNGEPRKEPWTLGGDDQVFSSLRPFGFQDPNYPLSTHWINPRVINLGGKGRDFYDHGNYIISTVGLNPLTGEIRPDATNLGRAFSNHFEMTVSPEEVQYHYGRAGQNPDHIDDFVYDDFVQRSMALRYDHGGEGIPQRLGMDGMPSYKHFEIRHGVPESMLLQSPDNIAEIIELVKDSGYTDLYLPRQWLAGVDRYPIERMMDEGEWREGILQAVLPDNSLHMNAYSIGRQIVSHPREAYRDGLFYPELWMQQRGRDDALILPWSSVSATKPRSGGLAHRDGDADLQEMFGNGREGDDIRVINHLLPYPDEMDDLD